MAQHKKSMKIAGIGAVAALVAGISANSAAAPAKPNIVVILMDDMGYGDIGPFGSTTNRTPNLDRMAAEGMKLNSFYCATVCTASRAQLMTGCYAKRVSLGLLFAVDSAGINSNEFTVAELLKAQGYSTMIVGKWHLGDQPEFLPTRHGFDHYLGLPYSNNMDNPPLPLMRDETVIEAPVEQHQLTALYTQESIKFITENTNRPFFLYLAHTATHAPLNPGLAFLGTSSNGIYGDWTEESDWSVGEVLKTLRTLNLDTNTLVLFTSDNGPVHGGGGGVPTPLNGYKFSTWEGGVREPTIAWWPGQIPSNTVCDTILREMDVLPTVVHLAGGEVPTNNVIDGRDIWPVLSGQTNGLPDARYYYFAGMELEAVRSGPWKLTIAPQKNPEIFASFVAPRLYNLDADIGETNDVAAQYSNVVQQLQGYIMEMDPDLGLKGNKKPGVRPAGYVANPQPLLLSTGMPARVWTNLWNVGAGDAGHANWSSNAIWVGGVVPGSIAGDAITFAAPANSATITLDPVEADEGYYYGQVTLGSMNFLAWPGKTYTLTPDTNNYGFTFNNSSNGAWLANGVGETGGDLTINNPITLADNLSITNNASGAGTIRLYGNIDESGGSRSISIYNMTATSGGLTLAASNSYSGATVIRAGILSLGSAGSIGNTRQISIAAGATFNVTNRASGFTFTGAGPQQTLAGSSTTGTAAIAAGTGAKAVTLASGALLSFHASGSTAGKISVAGDLNLSSNTITVNVAGSTLVAGTNRLLDCTGTLTGSVNPVPVITGTSLSSGYTAAISTTVGSGGYVDLVVTGSGSQAAVWTNIFTAPSAGPVTNWSSTAIWAGGIVPGSSAGDTIVFASAANNATITNDYGQVTMGAVNVAGAAGKGAKHYIFRPDTNNYGFTFNNNGNGAWLANGVQDTGNVTIYNPITLADNLSITNKATSTGYISLSGSIGESGGSRSLNIYSTFATNGGVTLAASNSYSGATVIRTGILSLGSAGSIGKTLQISIAAGSTFNVTSRTSGFTFTGANPQQTLAGSSTTGTAAIAAGTGAKAVTLASGALLSFQTAGGAGTTAGKISVAGDLNLSSNTITVNVAGLALVAGTNRLLDCTGTLTGSANATPVVTGIPLISGYTAAISTTTGAVGHVDLVVTAGQAQPVLASIVARTGSMELGGTGTPGQAYVLQTATNLTVPVIWLPILTNTAGTNGVFVFSDPQATNFAVRYYRITTP